MAWGDEIEAFCKFGETFPRAATMLIDTYDTLQGVRNAIASCAPMQAVRLDSGNLAELSKEVRRILDDAGRKDVQIVASGDLNEYKIRDLLAVGAPIDVFGVGTELVTSRDEPTLNTVYKLVEQETAHGAVGRYKLSKDKKSYPFAKQVFRHVGPDGIFRHDVIARCTEPPPAGGEPLLIPVFKQGQLVQPLPTLEECRRRFLAQRAQLSSKLLTLEPCDAYPVDVSTELEAELRRLAPRQ
jgi:nicotinate phosphoribosyltransferase